jgi:hypothetical protein
MRNPVADLPPGDDSPEDTVLPNDAAPRNDTGSKADVAEQADVAEEPVEYEADSVLLAAVGQARAALEEITSAESIGAPSGSIVHGEHVLSLLFESRLAGYPDWNWTVTLSRVDEDSAPSVLETELMPSDGSLVAPDWIPWSERLADYRLAQEHAAALAAAEADDEDDDLDDDEDDDLDEDDLDGGDDDGLDLDDHIDDDSELEHEAGYDSDGLEDEPVEAPPRRRSRRARFDASVVVDQANETPEHTGPRHLLDPHDEGFGIVSLDDEPRSSVYFDEEADREDH